MKTFIAWLFSTSVAFGLPSGGGGTPPTPPPPADPYILVLVFTDGDPAAAIVLEEDDSLLPKRFTTVGACNDKGTQWLSAAANPAGQTVLKFNCIQVKNPSATFLLDGNGGKLVAAPGNFLLAR